MKKIKLEFLNKVYQCAYDFKTQFQKRLIKTTFKALKHNKFNLALRIAAKDSFVNNLFEAAIIATKI